MSAQSTLLAKIYRLKLLAVALLLVMSGLLVSLFASWLEQQSVSHSIVALVNGLSDVLLVTGGLGIAVDFFTGREREEAETARTRSVLKELTPDFTDAVLKGLEVRPEDLKRVATPESLDAIATNALGLRLGDEQFAREIYADLRDQAIRAPERWYDVQVRVRLSSALERNDAGVPLFEVLVEWEYTTIPSHPVQRFACVSDREDFTELVTDVPATLTWFMTARHGLDARERRNYELLAFSIDGEERKIRRLERTHGQLYSASIGQDVLRAGQPVRVRQLFRVVTPRSGHRLYFEAIQPSRGFSLEVDYTDTDIAQMSVTELVSSSHRSRVSQTPVQVDARILGIDLPGWLLPKSGFAFVWTLRSELTEADVDAASSAPAKSA